MRRFLMASVAALSCLFLASNAVARGHDDRGGREWRTQGHHQQFHRGGPPHRAHPHHRRHAHPHARDSRRDWHRRSAPTVIVVPSARHHGGPRWSRGDRLPSHYRQPRYVVQDWRARRYAPPPRGYQWVNVGPEVLLVGIATGIVLQSIMGR